MKTSMWAKCSATAAMSGAVRNSFKLTLRGKNGTAPPAIFRAVRISICIRVLHVFISGSSTDSRLDCACSVLSAYSEKWSPHLVSLIHSLIPHLQM
jgi:hypothetical protein